MLSDNVGLWQYCRTDHCDIEDSDSQPWLHVEIFYIGSYIFLYIIGLG